MLAPQKKSDELRKKILNRSILTHARNSCTGFLATCEKYAFHREVHL